ncbi:lipocalin family protein [Dokdonella sp.]|uniref:lipocalin family protein n=1 Tax=Dokdonella sp. TaxID=2291710 RepID=UPI0035281CA5
MRLRPSPAPIVVLLAALLAGCATGSDQRPPLISSATVDLERYMGAWHVIGRIDYFGERGDVASEDVYTLASNGQVDTVYRYRKSFDDDAKVKTLKSVGLVQPDSGNAFWRIRFFGLFKADYLILEVAEDYSWALIGQPDRRLGWIFGRQAVMPDALYAELLAKMRGYGYNSSKLLRVAQVPEQVGKPGFHD